jgi:UrcA family protein
MVQFRHVATGLAAGLAMGVGFAMPAQAAEWELGAEGAPSMVVSYGDLDLRSAQGQAILAQRIERAANAVCGAVREAYDPLHGRIAFEDCRKLALKAGQERMALVLSGRKAG